ncbi:MAG: transglutaminase domain-containing protein [Gemmataceae bacterium]
MVRKAGLICAVLLSLGAAPPAPRRWPADVEGALGRAGPNRGELAAALTRAPADQRAGVAFLIAHMPQGDLGSLTADFLLENVALAYRARRESPWGGGLPEDVFLNDVLPYANLDEARDPWRKQFRQLCLPLVKDCKTPGEAARKLNATIFQKLNVRYSTGRKKACQSPKESIEQGLASCTGLSILLVDACRSVGVPARVAGTPLWANGRGNHTWVEVWDGRWRFTGAAEPDPAGLDRGWFVHDAAQAKKDSPEHAIYAASFRRTGLAFPLVWDRDRRDVPAENVSERYAARAPADPRVRVLVRVRRDGSKQRVELPVTVEERLGHCEKCRGQSRSETADTNDILAFDLTPGRDYVVRVGRPVLVEKPFRAMAAKEQLIDVEVPAEKTGLLRGQLTQIEQEARAFFEAAPEKQAGWRFDGRLDALLVEDEAAARRAVWKAYRESSVHAAMKKDFDANEVRSGEYRSPYTVKKVGKRPDGGWPVFLAMHGGGGVAKRVNDSQWQVMQRYYRDQADVTGYLYVALRAPNDVWNGFYADYVTPLVVNLVRQFLLFGDADPERVFLMGYSHGGYGAFFLGPKVPDRFAAVHASAAAPTEGTISPRTLRHTRFTFMIGEKDTAYGRLDRCKTFAASVEKLQNENPGDFPVRMELMAGHGHGGLPDRDKIKEMYPHRRDAAPRRLSWELTDGVVDRFFWLGVAKPRAGQSVEATIADNAVTLTTKNVEEVELSLDGRLARFDRPLRVTRDGQAREVTIRPSLATLCRSMAERGDPDLACTCRVRVPAAKR